MFRLLDEVETTGVGNTFVLPYTVLNHTIDCYFTNSGGSVTALTVDLEGSIDGQKWYTLASHEFTSDELNDKKAMFHSVDRMVSYIRANIITLTETGTTKIYVRYIPESRR